MAQTGTAKDDIVLGQDSELEQQEVLHNATRGEGEPCLACRGAAAGARVGRRQGSASEAQAAFRQGLAPSPGLPAAIKPTNCKPAAAGAPGLMQGLKEAVGGAGGGASDAAARAQGAAGDTAQAAVDKMRETGEVRTPSFGSQSACCCRKRAGGGTLCQAWRGASPLRLDPGAGASPAGHPFG